MEDMSEDMLAALELMQDDYILDFVVPLSVAIIACSVLYIKRR